ncbi:fungal-specific transcription factor domain-containing protein [Aspergillus filifer]
MNDPSRAKPRKYGFSCLVCRRRKVKCDGRRPRCVNCTRSSETCHYRDESTFVVRLMEDLEVKKARIKELESNIEELSALDSEARNCRLVELVAQLRQQARHHSPNDTRKTESSEPSPALIEGERQGLSDEVSLAGDVQYSVGINGAPQYFGATSRFHSLVDNRISAGSNVAEEASEVKEMEAYHQKWLTSNARFQQSWERLAHANIQQYTDADSDICSNLLQVYWAWQAPLHNCVYRRVFFRDMALGGPYFSRFLFNIILAHACRHMPDHDARFSAYERGETFLREAMMLLIDEIKQSKPRIPTIQGLLILGGRQCAVGKSSEGWLYTGMAIRMLMDLGLHLKRDSVSMMKDLEPDDLEVRKRLYLSVYAWDKSISLCLGRAPSLTEMLYPPSTLLDLFDDHDVWQPPHILETDNLYPETKCHSTLTFKYFCHLAEMVNESYHTVYSEAADRINTSAIYALEKRLYSFHEQLPAALRVEDATHLQTCIPPHILCLNILYHTILILIFRPFFTWRWHSRLKEHPLSLRAQAVCTAQTAAVDEIFRAYGRLFHFQYQSYLVSYCVYTAATIDVQLMKHEDKTVSDMAADRLVVTLQMLETEVKQTPGIRRSIEIIRSHLGPQWSAESESRLRTEAAANDNNTWSGAETSVPEFGSGSLPQSLAGIINTVSSPVQNQLQTPRPTQNLPRLSASDSVIEPSDYSLESSTQPLFNPNMDLDPALLGWSLDDFGGGFVPGMAHWNFFDHPIP